MKIYTRTGDSGETSLLGGARVPKHHLRIECYGTVDELNSWVGLVRAGFDDAFTTPLLDEIQNNLFVVGSQLAADPAKSNIKIPHIEEADITRLEEAMDAMDKELPALKNFILPGGNVPAANCHIARCVCRRAERLVTHLSYEEKVEPLDLKYLNRLSDYLFVLARYIAHKAGAEEIAWKPRG
ncbi:MAG TPA: cob(I)yrinic acid a,c-diamide adenosyltransferase [Bacteroidia bacterium]|nr:cob(I)yrinic acid a,c-diamide adenosyltransferase [Bacteroidia bacterium]